jgi:hypothetical protein
VTSGRIVAIAALSGASVAAVGFAGTGTPRPYAFAATEACLERLPSAVAGLPPATPPVPPAPFVYSFRPDRSSPRANGKLGVWYGSRGERAYEGITLTFFRTARDARASRRSLLWLYGGKLIRNVVVAWESSVPRARFQRIVLGCLRVTPPFGSLAPERSTRRASLATFAGYWGGHTRALRINSRGRGFESANSGCCVRLYEATFQLLSVSGTLTRATAVYRVTSFNRHDPGVPRINPGRVGKLLLRDGIVTNTLTQANFCSGPASRATGACGA